MNNAGANLASLHTTPGCSTAGADESGTLLTADCDASVASNAGCAVHGPTGSYGAPFNDAGGGIYVMEWTSASIRVWFFSRDSIPTSLLDVPDPSTFGMPMANFQGSCDVDEHFAQHRIVFDDTFCGDFAGATFASSGCPVADGMSSMQACMAYVGENPGAFDNAFWSLNSLKVYQAIGEVASTSSSVSSVTPVASTAAVGLTSLSAAMGARSSETLGSSSLSLGRSATGLMALNSSTTNGETGFARSGQTVPFTMTTNTTLFLANTTTTTMTTSVTTTITATLEEASQTNAARLGDPSVSTCSARSTSTMTTWIYTTVISCPAAYTQTCL